MRVVVNNGGSEFYKGGLQMLKIKRRELNDVVVLELKGQLLTGAELITGVASKLHEEINKIIEENWKKVVINLSDVKWMDSTGLGVLMAAYTSITNNNGDMKLVGANKKIENLFIITRLITVLKNYDSEEEAIAYFE